MDENRVVCKNCGAEFAGEACWTCGAPVESKVVELTYAQLSEAAGGYYPVVSFI